MILRRTAVAVTAGIAVLALAVAAQGATPSVASMTLQTADLAGAKSTKAGSVKEQGYLAAYERDLEFAKGFGGGKIVVVHNEVAVASSSDQPTKDVAGAQAQLKSKAGRASFATSVAKSFKVKRTAVAIGGLRGVGGYDQGFELPVSIKTKAARIYWNTALLRLDRVLVLLVEIGARPIQRGDTAKLASLVAKHISTALTPANVSPPAVTGTPQQGQTLTASPGTWNVDDAALTYQWQHCDAAGANCTDVAGATQPTYAVTAADVGFTIRVNVTATNHFGAPRASSAPTAAVT